MHPAERLWEKLAFHRDKLPLDTFDLSSNDGWMRFVEGSSLAKQIVEEVESELKEPVADTDGTWAVSQLLYGSNFEQYNARHGKTLSSRP
jgi:hypothetical protein